MNATMEANSSQMLQQDLSQSFHYTIIVPIFIAACVATFCLNLAIILAFPFIRNLSRVTRPYVTFILSLLISDMFAAFLLGLQLLCGAYLPVVFDVHIGGCLIFTAEAFKMAGVIVTVLHLLVMVVIHLLGVIHPVKFKEMMTQKVTRVTVVLLWLVPFGIILALFSCIPGQGFRSEGCKDHSILGKFSFRAGFSSFILLPTALILVLYAYFHYVLWSSRDVSKNSVTKQNIKAATTTLLIMFTCTGGWLPASVNFMLICEAGCRYQPDEFSFNTLFLMHSISNILVILKSFSNPLIFAMRQKHIKLALKRFLYFITHCRRAMEADLVLKPPQHNSTMRLRSSSSLRGGHVVLRDSTRQTLLHSSLRRT